MLLLFLSCVLLCLIQNQDSNTDTQRQTHSFSLKKNRATQNTTLQDLNPQTLGYADLSLKLTKFHEKSYHQVVIKAVRAKHRTMTQLSLALCILGLQTLQFCRTRITTLQLHTYIAIVFMVIS